jgi:tRNA/rRNA methyltransferase
MQMLWTGSELARARLTPPLAVTGVPIAPARKPTKPMLHARCRFSAVLPRGYIAGLYCASFAENRSAAFAIMRLEDAMPGAGTDKTKDWVATPGPIVILVEPQLGENIGAAARAMANFGLARLRLVNPREPWPNPQARKMASGADRVLDEATLFDTLEAAIGDCTFVLATTARAHDQAKPVIDAAQCAQRAAPLVAAGENVAILFGRERTGLENEEVALADCIVTLPVNPAFASLNLAQAVAILAYEWFKLVCGGGLPFAMPQKSPPASKEQLLNFFAAVERELEKVEFFRPPDKRETMQINLRNIFTRMQPTQQDIRTLHGVIMAIAEGRKGPARGGVLDSAEAEMLRALLAEHGQGRVPGERGPVRGLARLLRRNPTEAERTLWQALTRDRRFAGKGFKRQVPVGPHITDFVSFPLRLVIELAPADESETAANARRERRAWLAERGYRVVDVEADAVETRLDQVLDDLAQQIGV